MTARRLINPGGGAVHIPDVTAYLDGCRAEDIVPFLDLGGGMVVPLGEHLQQLREQHTADLFEAAGE